MRCIPSAGYRYTRPAFSINKMLVGNINNTNIEVFVTLQSIFKVIGGLPLLLPWPRCRLFRGPGMVVKMINGIIDDNN